MKEEVEVTTVDNTVVEQCCWSAHDVEVISFVNVIVISLVLVLDVDTDPI